jgi:SHS family lactate transporter-like MFS transporter
LKIISIASPVLKCVLPDAPPLDARVQHDVFGSSHTFEDQPRLIGRALEIAERTGARIIRVFSYWRTVDPARCLDRVVSALSGLADQAQERGLTIGLENEHACNIATGEEAGRLLAAIDHPALKAIWDPANAFVMGENAFPDGYSKLPAGRIVHVHAKDCHVRDHKPTWGPLGEMGLDWTGQIGALRRDGYAAGSSRNALDGSEGGQARSQHHLRPQSANPGRQLAPMRSGSDHLHAVIASFLGWMLDAFDFFIVVFVLTEIGADFGRSRLDMALAITVTLATRPIGAFIFGLMADRYGRRLPLMIDLVFFSVVAVLSGLAPNYWTFILLRALFGVGMGGEWGVGASLAMEKAPRSLRGVLSGLLQQGYAAGYLLAACCYLFVFPHLGWRAMFFIGGLPALLAIYVRYGVKESEVWERTRHDNWSNLGRAILSNWKTFLYIFLLITAMGFVSHGTQDLYPTFLKLGRGLSQQMVSYVAIIYNVGAIIGGIVMGRYSDKMGRRRAMVTALVFAIVIIPVWAYAPTISMLIGRVHAAVHGAGSLGCDSGPHQRADAGFGARIPARICLSVRHRGRRGGAVDSRGACRPLRVRERHGGHGAHGLCCGGGRDRARSRETCDGIRDRGSGERPTQIVVDWNRQRRKAFQEREYQCVRVRGR